MVQLAPSVMGDYYARYGTQSDIAWLKRVPDDFPYPASQPGTHSLIRAELSRESKRAIDAIRLRN
jgi:hypothetical protein